MFMKSQFSPGQIWDAYELLLSTLTAVHVDPDFSDSVDAFEFNDVNTNPGGEF